MKICFLIWLLVLSASAQDSLIRGGNFLGSNLGGRRQTPEEIQAAKQAEIQERSRLLGAHIFRRVNGKIINMLTVGQRIFGKVDSIEDDGEVIIWSNNYNSDRTAIKNFPGTAISDSNIACVAVASAPYRSGSAQFVQWDCGQQILPTEEKQQVDGILNARKQKLDRENLINKTHDFLAQSNAVVWLSNQATNGDVSAEYDLADHYLNGIGCQTNRSEGIYWLKKAASSGSADASNKLAKLTPP